MSGNEIGRLTVRLTNATERELEQVAKMKRCTKSELLREAVDNYLFETTWLAKCDAVLKTSINQVNESHRALEARIQRLVDEGAIDFEIQTLNKEIAASEERIKADLKADFELKFQAAFDKMLRALPNYIIQLHENQKAANNQRRES